MSDSTETVDPGEKYIVGERVFILWPGLEVYDIVKSRYKFVEVLKELQLVEMIVCDRMLVSGRYSYRLAFASKDDHTALIEPTGEDWDKPRDWHDLIARTKNQVLMKTLMVLRPIEDGYQKLCQRVETMLPAEPGL